MPKETKKQKKETQKIVKTKTSKTMKRKSQDTKTKTRRRKKKLAPITTVLRKSEIYALIAEDAGMTRKKIADIFDKFAEIMNRHLVEGGAGKFTIPNLVKIETQKKSAVKRRKGISPFTGEPMVFKAKPARRIVKLRALKRLKEMADS